MRFVNLEPWPANTELVECRIGDRRYDLHNAASVGSVSWTPPEELSLHFQLLHEYMLRPSAADTIVLRFFGIRRLSVVQPDDWVPEEVDASVYWNYRSVSDDDGAEVFFTLAGLDLTFVARGVELIEISDRYEQTE